jgi:hypothetical protein
MTTTMTSQVAQHERRLDQHDDDLRHLYREIKDVRREMRQEFRWLRRSMFRVMAHLGIEPPGDEEE